MIAALPLALGGSAAAGSFAAPAAGAGLGSLLMASMPQFLNLFGGGSNPASMFAGSGINPAGFEVAQDLSGIKSPMERMMGQMMFQNSLSGMGNALNAYGQSQTPQQQPPSLVPAKFSMTGRQPTPYTPPPYMFPFLPKAMRGLPPVGQLGGRFARGYGGYG